MRAAGAPQLLMEGSTPGIERKREQVFATRRLFRLIGADLSIAGQGHFDTNLGAPPHAISNGPIPSIYAS